MSVWKGSNQAALATWVALKALDQIAFSKTFFKTGPTKMNRLSFWSATGTDTFREIRATTLAMQLDHTYRQIFNAKYESGATANNSRSDMKEILLKGSNTVEDLAEVVDSKYKFLAE